MLIAIFGDVHGNLPGVDDLTGRWEASRRRTIDAVFLAGDVGLFPDPRQVDRATRNHGDKDETNFLAAKYVSGEFEMSHQVYFCRGNHEDHPFLRMHANQAVDPKGKLVYWAGGDIHQLGDGGNRVRVLTIGGIHPSSWVDPFTDPKGRRTPPERYFDTKELRAVESIHPGAVDVLLTHDGPVGMSHSRKPDAGSPFLLQLVEQIQPRFHFFGHYGIPQPPARVGKTWVVPLNQPSVVRVPLRDGGMGVLDTETWKFEFVFDVDHETEPREEWGALQGAVHGP